MIISRTENVHLRYLDGVRGLLSLWVFVIHTAFFAGWEIRLNLTGSVAVDCFMLVSGLLMVWNLELRETYEPLKSRNTILKFYIRRIFRVAPLYYLLFLYVLVFSNYYENSLRHVWTVFPPPWHEKMPNDPSIRGVSFGSVIFHLTFIFGAIPQYANNNALPDWTLSLEMQFYFIIPFLLLTSRRIGWLPVVFICLMMQLTINHYVGLGLQPKLFGLYPQPAFLPFNISAFLAGCLIAIYARDNKNILAIVLIFVNLLIFRNTLFLVLGCLIFFLTAKIETFKSIRSAIDAVLSSQPLQFLGSISYGVYLIHMLILLPLASYLAGADYYLDLSARSRFAVLFVLCLIPVLVISRFLNKFIELPGIRLGHRLSSSLSLP